MPPLSDADYAALKRRLASDTVSVGALHVRGDVDCNAIRPRLPLQLGNGARLYSGSGAPSSRIGNVGDGYHRIDTPSTANQRFYIATAKSAGVTTWTGIL